MAAFAMMFGTRHINSTEHHDGLMLAIAFESLVKLFSFCAVGYYAGYQLHGGIGELLLEATSNANVQQLIGQQDTSGYTTAVVLGMAMIICLPRLFHVLVVESRGPEDADTVQWFFPLYTLVLAFFTLLIVLAGILYFQTPGGNTDSVFISLPVANQQTALSLFAYLGGLSAATSMVIVATITLALMICNDIVMPVLFRYRLCRVHQRENVASLLQLIRRVVIVVVLLLAYLYYRVLGSYDDLGAIGLLSLSLIVQLAPAMIGALFWSRGHKVGVISGIVFGSVIWFYTLLIPTVIRAGQSEQNSISCGGQSRFDSTH
jgi:Na+/proline symporter